MQMYWLFYRTEYSYPNIVLSGSYVFETLKDCKNKQYDDQEVSKTPDWSGFNGSIGFEFCF